MSLMLFKNPWVVSLATLGTVLVSLWKLWWKPQLERKQPFVNLPMPSQKGHWFFGHVHFARASSLEESYKLLLQNCDERGRIGFYMFSSKVVALTHWSDVRRVLYAEHKHKVVHALERHLGKFLGPHNIGFLNDRLWKHERVVVLKSLAASLPKVKAITKNVISTLGASLRRRIQEEQTNSFIIDVLPLLKMVTLDVFGNVAFSHSFGCCTTLQESAVAAAFSFLSKDLTRRLMTGPVWPTNYFYSIPTTANRQHAKDSNVLRQFLAERIAAKQCQKDMEKDSDLLTSLIHAHQSLTEEQSQKIPLDELMIDILLSLLFAGFDTTSITLSYVLYVTSAYPDIGRSCREEITRVGLDNMEDLVYCRAVMRETLRLYPPPFTTQRFLQKPVILHDGYEIPANTLVMCPIWYIQRCAYNFERPTEFRPDRWVRHEGTTWVPRVPSSETPNDSLPDIAAGNLDAFFTFSAGARSCPGQSFAWSEALIVMANLLHHFEFSLLPGYVMQPDRHGIVQQPKGGLPFTINVREEQKQVV